MMIRFNQDECSDLATSLKREWLETNGIGGYASSTIIGLNARRYHALLMAATKPPIERFALLSKLEETLIVNGTRYELSANRYPNTIYPRGYEYLTAFRLDPFPIFTYTIAGFTLEKALWMIYGENSVVVQYTLQTTDASATINTACQLELRPLAAFRDYHHIAHENDALDRRIEIGESLVSFTPYAHMPTLYLAHDASSVERTGYWYRNFEYEMERERGLDYREDLFNPLMLRYAFDLDSSDAARVSLIASTKARDAARADVYRADEKLRRQTIRAAAPTTHVDFAIGDLLSDLACAADQFIVARGAEKTVIAGYHWFGDWGRDTMIALPGLTLTTGRAAIARSILQVFAHYIDRGMLPNRFPDEGERPDYNTVDATLWYFEAVRALLAASPADEEFVHAQLYDHLAEIIAWHVRGTRYNIRVDTDGLLASGAEGTQLTWMDAKVGDWVVTPRRGKPVEIQALWYNALCVMRDLAARYADDARRRRYDEMAAHAKENFNRAFWNKEAACLYDVIDETGRPDASLRPNQIFAVSLAHTMLESERSRAVVAAVERELLTPYGLRSLAPSDSQYRGRYEGDTLGRDGSYHQGAVWAWLMGPFITAYLKTHGRTETTRAQIMQYCANFRTHLQREAGLGQVSEIFDGDSPHTPRGAIAQAWSVAELLRALVEAATQG